jgi:hypothetical protein
MFKIQVVVEPVLKHVNCIHGLYYSYFIEECHLKYNLSSQKSVRLKTL